MFLIIVSILNRIVIFKKLVMDLVYVLICLIDCDYYVNEYIGSYNCLNSCGGNGILEIMDRCERYYILLFNCI